MKTGALYRAPVFIYSPFGQFSHSVASVYPRCSSATALFAQKPNVKWFKPLLALDRVNVGLETPAG